VLSAWLREIEESDEEGNPVCTGLFECTLGERDQVDEDEPRSFAAAVAWAQEHADRAFADIEWERYVVVGDVPELPPVPPELAERLEQGRRRPARDAWRDRPTDSPPTRWEIVVDLGPPDLRPDRRPEQERVVEAVAARLTADGCDAVEWTPGELDAAMADIDALRLRAGEREVGWMLAYKLAFVVTAAAEAPTYRPVLARVRRAVLEALEAAGARPLPEPEAAPIEGRWRFDVDVHPPGYEWSPPLL
jgi:hypothetical protein